jgi:hypothetical protein
MECAVWASVVPLQGDAHTLVTGKPRLQHQEHNDTI